MLERKLKRLAEIDEDAQELAQTSMCIEEVRARQKVAARMVLNADGQTELQAVPLPSEQ